MEDIAIRPADRLLSFRRGGRRAGGVGLLAMVSRAAASPGTGVRAWPAKRLGATSSRSCCACRNGYRKPFGWSSNSWGSSRRSAGTRRPASNGSGWPSRIRCDKANGWLCCGMRAFGCPLPRCRVAGRNRCLLRRRVHRLHRRRELNRKTRCRQRPPGSKYPNANSATRKSTPCRLIYRSRRARREKNYRRPGGVCCAIYKGPAMRRFFYA
jgi:hypothetical protein